MKKIFQKTFLIVSVFVLTLVYSAFIVSSTNAADCSTEEAAKTEAEDATLEASFNSATDAELVVLANAETAAIEAYNTCIRDLATATAAAGAATGATAGTTTTTTTKTQTTASTTLYNPLGTDSIETFVGRSIRIVLSMAGIAAFLMFIWGGILWMTSAGSADRVQKGKDTLIWATIGLVVLFSAYAIVETLVTVLSTGGI